jgi:phenylacetate-CoA ligase
VRLTPLQPWIARRIVQPGPDLDPAALRRWQSARLRDTIALARSRSAFYRGHFAHVPNRPDGEVVPARYPFTTPSDLARHGLRLVCVGQDDIERVVTLDTSGTTGAPKRLYFSRADQELTLDFFAVGMSTFTDPGDRVLVLLPCERPGGVGDLLAVALQRLAARPIRYGVVADPGPALELVRSAAVDVVVGVPAQVRALAMASSGARLKAVLLSTDHVPAAAVAVIEAAWGCRVFNHYGMTETGLGAGVECEARRGYHLREADLYVEIVDPATGLAVPDGQPGEVVISTLTRDAMPLIRYRTGDLSRFLPGACPCGTVLRTLERVTRRTDGVVDLAGQPFARADLDEALYARTEVVDFEVTLRRGAGSGRPSAGPPEPVDRLEVTIRMDPRADPVTASAAARAAVEAVPQVAVARSAGRLELQVQVAAAPAFPGPAKRRMAVLGRADEAGRPDGDGPARRRRADRVRTPRCGPGRGSAADAP